MKIEDDFLSKHMLFANILQINQINLNLFVCVHICINTHTEKRHKYLCECIKYIHRHMHM